MRGGPNRPFVTRPLRAADSAAATRRRAGRLQIDITTKDGGAIARQLKIGSAFPVFVYKDKRVLGFTPAKLDALLKG